MCIYYVHFYATVLCVFYGHIMCIYVYILCAFHVHFSLHSYHYYCVLLMCIADVYPLEQLVTQYFYSLYLYWDVIKATFIHSFVHPLTHIHSPMAVGLEAKRNGTPYLYAGTQNM